MPRRPLVTIHQAVAWSGLPASTLRRWMAEGRIVAHGTHNRRLYDLHEVAQVMEHLGRRHRKDTA